MTITVDYHQTNRKVDTGKTLKRWPVFVDHYKPSPRTFNLTTEAVERHITAKTKVVLPVHLYVQLSTLEEVMAVASQDGLLVLEDSAQTYGPPDKGEKSAPGALRLFLVSTLRKTLVRWVMLVLSQPTTPS